MVNSSEIIDLLLLINSANESSLRIFAGIKMANKLINNKIAKNLSVGIFRGKRHYIIFSIIFSLILLTPDTFALGGRRFRIR